MRGWGSSVAPILVVAILLIWGVGTADASVQGDVYLHPITVETGVNEYRVTYHNTANESVYIYNVTAALTKPPFYYYDLHIYLFEGNVTVGAGEWVNFTSTTDTGGFGTYTTTVTVVCRGIQDENATSLSATFYVTYEEEVQPGVHVDVAVMFIMMSVFFWTLLMGALALRQGIWREKIAEVMAKERPSYIDWVIWHSDIWWRRGDVWKVFLLYAIYACYFAYPVAMRFLMAY